MKLTGPFILSKDVVLQPVTDLPDEVRRAIGKDDGAFALSRVNSRVHSKVVDAETANLIRNFEKPCTIAQAVARFSRGKAASAEELLDDALPLLQSLIAQQLLVQPDSQKGFELEPTLAPDDSVEGSTVIRCIQTLEDTEVYLTRGPLHQFGALKIAKVGAGSAATALAREAHILARLDAMVTPRLLGAGEWNGRPYLLTEWRFGVDAQSASAKLREDKGEESRRELLRLTGAVLEAYAALHQQGTTHGDIHPRNVLIDRNGKATIVDLGLARSIRGEGDDDTLPRGGIAFFFEPEFARAILHGIPPPPSSVAGEQYGLAALLYLLLTGSHYLEFSFEKKRMLGQIAEEPMIPFAERGVEAWPEVERIIARALEKEPAARFSSTREFALAWRSVEAPRPPIRAVPTENAKLAVICKEALQKCALSGPLFNGTLAAPATSLNYGSAGVACALYRIACASDDAELLALADLWSARSLREIGDKGAFYAEAFQITPETVGQRSLYHSPIGLHAVQALIAQARGDIALQCAATEAFIRAAREPCQILDLAFGEAGFLLGSAFLLDAFSDSNRESFVREQKTRLKACGQEIKERLWRKIEDCQLIGEAKGLTNFGVAHGWAGLLYATLCWSASAGEPLPSTLAERLQQLGACAEPIGRGLQWKWIFSDADHRAGGGYMPGWCNGSAGFVFLWTEAHKAIGDPYYLQLAEGAAWHAWEAQSQVATLCCGFAGQAYALLNLYRHTGDKVWLRRAEGVAARAAAAAYAMRGRSEMRSDYRAESLYKGDMGVAVLAVDLRRPEQAAMPMFEREIPNHRTS
jgi:eukaryotic-like serine/threonine-protein kinase